MRSRLDEIRAIAIAYEGADEGAPPQLSPFCGKCVCVSVCVFSSLLVVSNVIMKMSIHLCLINFRVYQHAGVSTYDRLGLVR